jgi:cobaltochelatase CobS
MGAIPARWVAEVTADFDDDNEVVVAVSFGASNRPVPREACVWVGLGELSRQELRRAAANLGLGLPRSASNDELTAAIRAAVLGGVVPSPAPVVPEPAPEPTAFDGKHRDFDRVLRRVQAGLTPWLHGEAGTGKTTLAIQIAEAMGLPFHGISVTNETTITTFFGYTDANRFLHRTDFREAWEHGGIFLLDEASSARPTIAAGINMALANGVVSFPDGMIKRHPDCFIIAAANDTGQGPTPVYPKGIKQDSSFLDRFVMNELLLDQRVVDAGVAERLENAMLRRQWMLVWHKARENRQAFGLHNFVVTPRSAFDGATLLSIGESLRDAAVDCILKGDTSDAARKVLDGTGITL